MQVLRWKVSRARMMMFFCAVAVETNSRVPALPVTPPAPHLAFKFIQNGNDGQKHLSNLLYEEEMLMGM